MKVVGVVEVGDVDLAVVEGRAVLVELVQDVGLERVGKVRRDERSTSGSRVLTLAA